MRDLRAACAAVAAQARFVEVCEEVIPQYAASPGLGPDGGTSAPRPPLIGGGREHTAAFWITLDAINFGSGWFPTLRKRDGRSGYFTIASALAERFASRGPWSARELARLDAAELAATLGQDRTHELMGLFARSLNDVGRHLDEEFGGSWCALADSGGESAVALARGLGAWPAFADVSRYDGIELPFLKRAQITAADLARAGVAAFNDLQELTIFADNLVPHVLRLDGVLRFDPRLVARIERGELIEHDSPEEIEIRACALHAVELIVAARPGTTAMALDELLWRRGQEPRYKASPRHRSRCTAY